MKKSIQVCGFGHALVDILLDVTESEFAALGLERATMRLVEPHEQRALLDGFGDRDRSLVSGGSVANSIIAVAQLGGKAALLSAVGDDRYGLFYKSECEALGIDFVNPPRVGDMTGTVAILVTPDAERTMRTCLGASLNLDHASLDEDTIARSEWLFIEGYLFANPSAEQLLVRIVEIAARHNTKLALTFSEQWVLQGFGARVRELVKHCHLVFANHAESTEFTGEADPARARDALAAIVPNAVVTAGPLGAFCAYGGQKFHTPAFECVPRDLTGAGDMFAGTFLYGVTNGISATESARAACYLAREVITRVGPRLHEGARSYWESCMQNR